MEYRDTLITVSDDCPARSSVVPKLHGGRRTVAMLHYELAPVCGRSR